MSFLSDAKEIGEILATIPKKWDGKKVILEMKSVGFPHWRQMEWMGFYFQFLCNKYLSSIMQIPGPKYGRVEFDGFKNIAWDFKAHAINTSSHKIIVNDSESIAYAIGKHGAFGLILALGKVLYNDEDKTFKKWHDDLKGGQSEYERKRIERGAWSRLRKVSVDLEQIAFIKITDTTLVKCGSFQVDFRNSNGNLRKAKVLLDLEDIDEELEYTLDF